MNRYQVILAEDHVIVRQGIKRLLEEDPEIIVVAEVGDGLELMEVVRKILADLVILDISMPNLSGIEATKRIKELYPDKKVLILTMHKGKELVLHALRAGADGYLLKEDHYEDFLTAIKVVCRGGIFVSPLLVSHMGNFFVNGSKILPTIRPTDLLTSRELEVLNLVGEGKSSREIGAILCLSFRTIQQYRTNIKRKLHLDTTTDLIKFAVSQGHGNA